MYQYAGPSPCIEHVEGARSKATNHFKEIKGKHHTTTQSESNQSLFHHWLLYRPNVYRSRGFERPLVLLGWTRPATVCLDRTISSIHNNEKWNARQGGVTMIEPSMEGGDTIRISGPEPETRRPYAWSRRC